MLEENTLAVLPPLVGAFDNFVFRQLYLYFRWDGDDAEAAFSRVEDFQSGRWLSRYDIVGDGFEDAIGERLEDSAYADQWDDFGDSVIDRRNDIAHPTSETHLQAEDREAALDWYNETIAMFISIFDLFHPHYEWS
jgi:hypothetical protein